MRPLPTNERTAARSFAFLAALGFTAMASCGSPGRPAEGGPLGAHNLWLGGAHRAQAVEGAVLRERTLYAHHFVDGGPELNQLGLRDLGWLAQRYRELPGKLNVRRGGADGELYEARLEEVRRQLGQLGVEAARVDLADGLPGGDGISARGATEALEATGTGLESSVPPLGSAGSSPAGSAGAFDFGAAAAAADNPLGGQR